MSGTAADRDTIRIEVRTRSRILRFSIPFWRELGAPKALDMHRTGIGPVRLTPGQRYPVRNAKNRPHIDLSAEDLRRYRLHAGEYSAALERGAITFTPPVALSLERFTGSRQAVAAPVLHVAPNGVLALNAAAYALLNATTVALLYDSAQSILAIRAAPDGGAGTYRISQVGLRYQTHPRAFFAYHQIDTGSLVGEYDVQVQDGTLLVDLLTKREA